MSPENQTDAGTSFQDDTYELFAERAPHLLFSEDDNSIKARVARMILGAVSPDQADDHPSQIENGFLPANHDRTNKILSGFMGRIANIENASQLFMDFLNLDELKKQGYKEAVVISPHTSLFDIQALALMSLYDRNRQPEDNIIYLSRLHGFTEYTLPPFFGKTRNVALDLVAAGGNILQLYPHSATMDKFNGDHKRSVVNANRNATKQSREFIEKRQNQNNGEIILHFVAPSASRMRDGALAELRPENLALLQRMFVDGIPIFVAGAEVDLIQALVWSRIPMLNKPKISVACTAKFIPDPPHKLKGVRKKVRPQADLGEIYNSLQKSASNVMGYEINLHPKNQPKEYSR